MLNSSSISSKYYLNYVLKLSSLSSWRISFVLLRWSSSWLNKEVIFSDKCYIIWCVFFLWKIITDLWHWLNRQLELFCYWKNCQHKFWAFHVAAKAQFSNHKILHLSRNRAQRVSLLLDIHVWKIPEYSKFIKPFNFLQHGRRTLTKQSCVTNINKELTWFYSA